MIQRSGETHDDVFNFALGERAGDRAIGAKIRARIARGRTGIFVRRFGRMKNHVHASSDSCARLEHAGKKPDVYLA